MLRFRSTEYWSCRVSCGVVSLCLEPVGLGMHSVPGTFGQLHCTVHPRQLVCPKGCPSPHLDDRGARCAVNRPLPKVGFPQGRGAFRDRPPSAPQGSLGCDDPRDSWPIPVNASVPSRAHLRPSGAICQSVPSTPTAGGWGILWGWAGDAGGPGWIGGQTAALEGSGLRLCRFK